MAITTSRAAPTTGRASWLTFSRREALTGYLLVVPVCLVLLGLVAYPFFFAIFIAFTDRMVGTAGNWVGLDNFRYLAGQPSFQKTIVNTILIVVITGVVKLVIGLGLSLLLNEQLIGRGFFRSLVLLPWAIPGFVAFLVWRLLFQPVGGGVNLLLQHIGFENVIIDWLGQKQTALPAVIIATIWRGFPFWVVSFLAALQSVPVELYEAAKIDGANAWDRFLAVTLPSIRPVIYTVALLSSIWTANSFENIWIMTQGGPSDATMVFPVLAYFGMQTQRIGEAAAVSVALAPVLILLVVIVSALMDRE